MRRILLLAALLLAAIQLSAAPVDVHSAQLKAQNFVQQKLYGGRLMAPLTGEMKLAHAEMNSKMLDRAVFYIFNSNNGYVIVAGDDRAEEILGYGDTPLDYSKIPCNMKAWLGTYKDQIEYLQAHEGLQVETPSMMAPKLNAQSVEPLLTALWDQEAPYWNQCKINNYQCLTGCPATSAAMVLHYWKYPDYPTPVVPGYRCNLAIGNNEMTVNVDPLPSITFDWNNMLDRYTSGYTTDQANAVAALMRYVGQAERMEYGNSAAGGSGINVDSVSLIVDMFKLFGYDEETVRLVKKTSAYSGGTTLYTDAQWAAIMQEELAEGRPIVFCAVSGGWFGGGHAFNVDGYDATTNKYHINFGWSGSYNNYYAINAFNGGGSTYNQYQQMVIGVQPPIKMPRLKADATQLSMSCYKNATATATFNLNGRNLEGNVTMTINDENGVFSIEQSTLVPDENNQVNVPVVVTYAPKAEGNYVATLTISAPDVEDIVITLNGSSDYELYRPVMLDADESAITSTSFRANWADATPAENVSSYTLEVWARPEVTLLAQADWSDVPTSSANQANNAANYMPEGWTFSGSYLFLDGGFLSPGYNCVIDANFDLMNYNKVSVVITGKAYPKSTMATKITVSTDLEEKTITLATDVDSYVVVLEIGETGHVSFTAGYYPEIQSIQIYGGEMAAPSFNAASETGDATYRLIEGITPDKFYNVTGLTPGETFLYRVKSLYVTGDWSVWSNLKEVKLNESASVRADVNGDGEIGIDDVTDLISYLLNGNGDNIDLSAADVDLDGEIGINDVTDLISYLLTGSWE